jgi:uncharacterized SAM-binding protein YcdF (DUF218 family)
MSTRWPAHVKRAVVTAQEGTVSGLRRPLWIALGILVLAWIGTSLYLFVFPRTDSPGRADAVVVLSGGRNSRLDPALKLMQRKVAPLLVISGAGLDPKWKKARRLCADGARGFRVLCFDPRPYSTRGEAEEVGRLARRRGWNRIDVVTSTYHVTRARMIFRRCYHKGLAVIGTSYPVTYTPAAIVSEWGKLLYQLTFQRSC